ncbi:related to Broad-specificity phosphatase YOR283W [Saccharomycodes ludwigii]|uniref:Related to Broad-specificity phosphatase YOR283W n=1 Tax=Saccharomycodes ludwigii TaxID=36035 RepID=A0A376B4W8_9ASCO|nr:hypothetical protein SCDLUD_000400 [Saccharomycodes ludwigii]KAH3902809.1 hypothetical protein SCDLUD_000400 [Saccharomycodes ludwigii]SSD59737.1 related to Broad-specificity phosphatase YOR283W [Saccharomycodes ludwigii]
MTVNNDEVYYTTNTDPNVLRIFIIRHGQTNHNVKKILQGHLDTDLNEEGLEQAFKVGKYLHDNKRIKFEKFYSSDLKRCQQTLKQILKSYEGTDTNLQGTVVFSDQLRERSMGVIQGMHIDDAIEYAKKNGKASYREFGEQKNEFHNRLTKAFEKMVQQEPNAKNIGLISHGGSIRYILSWLGYKSDVDDVALKLIVYNTSVTIIDYIRDEKVFKIRLIGNTNHLGDGKFVVNDTRVR